MRRLHHFHRSTASRRHPVLHRLEMRCADEGAGAMARRDEPPLARHQIVVVEAELVAVFWPAGWTYIDSSRMRTAPPAARASQ
jgi:hypothetical protein